MNNQNQIILPGLESSYHDSSRMPHEEAGLYKSITDSIDGFHDIQQNTPIFIKQKIKQSCQDTVKSPYMSVQQIQFNEVEFKNQEQEKQLHFCASDGNESGIFTKSNNQGHKTVTKYSKQQKPTHFLEKIRKKTRVVCTPKSEKNVWKKSGLFIVAKIKKFIEVSKNKLSSNRFLNLSQQQFQLIDDQSVYMRYYTHKYQMKKMKVGSFGRCQYEIYNSLNKYTILKIVHKLWQKGQKEFISKIMLLTTIEPESYFKYIWDFVVMVILLMLLLYKPLKIAFHKEMYLGNDYKNILDFTFYNVPSVVFISDILINMNTSYYDKGNLEMSKSKVIINYFNKSFLWDFVIYCCFFLSFEYQYFSFPIFLKSLDMFEKFNKIVFSWNLNETNQGIMQLLKLVFIIMFSAHICGCSFYFMHTWEKDNGEGMTWVDKYDLSDSHWSQKYVSALYFSVITMITVGYGDISPVNYSEKIFVIIITLVSCGIFAYSVNQIGSIVENLTKKSTEIQRKLCLLTTYLKKRGVNFQLQLKVKKYFEYLNQDPNLEDEVGDQILKSLVGNLRKEVLVEIYGKLLKSQKVFKLNFTEQFLNALALQIKEMRVEPQRIIYDYKNPCYQIFFLMEGEVEEFVDIKKGNHFKKIKVLEKHDVFNIKQFFSDSISNTGAITKTVTTIGFLTKESFLDTLNQFPDDKQVYQAYKDKLNLNFNYEGLGIQCQSCNQFGHDIDHCQFSQYVPNTLQIIHIHNNQSELQQERKHYERDQYTKYNTYDNAWLVREMAIQYLIDQDDINENELVFNLQNIQNAHQAYENYTTNLILAPLDQNQNKFVANKNLSPIESYDHFKHYQESSYSDLNNATQTYTQTQSQSQQVQQGQTVTLGKHSSYQSFPKISNKSLDTPDPTNYNNNTININNINNNNIQQTHRNSLMAQQNENNIRSLSSIETLSPDTSRISNSGKLKKKVSIQKTPKQVQQNQQSIRTNFSSLKQEERTGKIECMEQKIFQKQKNENQNNNNNFSNFSDYIVNLKKESSQQYINSNLNNEGPSIQTPSQFKKRARQKGDKQPTLIDVPLDGKILQLLKQKLGLQQRKGGRLSLISKKTQEKEKLERMEKQDKAEENPLTSIQALSSKFIIQTGNQILEPASVQRNLQQVSTTGVFNSEINLKSNSNVNNTNTNASPIRQNIWISSQRSQQQKQQQQQSKQQQQKLQRQISQSPIMRQKSKQYSNLVNSQLLRQYSTKISSPVRYQETYYDMVSEMEKEIKMDQQMWEQKKFSEIEIDQYKIWNKYFVKHNINVVLEDLNRQIFSNIEQILGNNDEAFNKDVQSMLRSRRGVTKSRYMFEKDEIL